jgi:hypothetical protein
VENPKCSLIIDMAKPMGHMGLGLFLRGGSFRRSASKIEAFFILPPLIDFRRRLFSNCLCVARQLIVSVSINKNDRLC